jgi:hypothetical protein
VPPTVIATAGVTFLITTTAPATVAVVSAVVGTVGLAVRPHYHRPGRIVWAGIAVAIIGLHRRIITIVGASSSYTPTQQEQADTEGKNH